ncbi:universal stress protein [Streptomyces sp. HUAS MG47]|uniref:universal stress protein n=1 Tax=Streptomyces solicamelliae TaxID=3231716 RepID=UPI00387817F2
MDGSTARPDLGRVVVGVDGSPSAHAAARWAAAEAVLRDAGLVIVHATETAGMAGILSPESIAGRRQSGQALLDRTAEAVAASHPELVLVKELSGGSPVDSLRRAAAPGGTIAVGHQALGGFSSHLLGPVGLKVAAHATTPVVVVRGAGGSAEAGAVLTAVRDVDDLGCARAAAHEARLRNVPLRLLHVSSTPRSGGAREAPPNGAEEVARDHERALSEVADRVRDEFPDLEVHADCEQSRSVPGTLVDASRHVDLLVAGGRREPGHRGPAIGRTTLHLLQQAHCPVELIPRHGPGR